MLVVFFSPCFALRELLGLALLAELEARSLPGVDVFLPLACVWGVPSAFVLSAFMIKLLVL